MTVLIQHHHMTPHPSAWVYAVFYLSRMYGWEDWQNSFRLSKIFGLVSTMIVVKFRDTDASIVHNTSIPRPEPPFLDSKPESGIPIALQVVSRY